MMKPIHLILAAMMFAGITATGHAAECSINIEADDALRYTPAHINVPKVCTDFTVKLTHTGRLPKLAMGHNWVLVEAADMSGVARTGMAAGAEQDYVDKADTRVIAYTPVIGSGESTSVTFPVKRLKTGVAYTFFCSFAGHSPIMQGTLSVTP